MQKTLTLLVAVSLAGAASAQTKIEKPFRAELGLYIPTFSDGGKSLGGDVGVGLAAAQVHLGTDFGDGDTTKLGYSVEAGYDLSEKLYGLVRFQATTDDIRPYQGVTVGVGYRF